MQKRNASKLWRSQLQKNYRNFDEWESFDRCYGLAKRLGFDSAQEAWDANPTIQGGIDPKDFSVVKPREAKQAKRILSITIKRMVDDSPDTSYLGEYSARPSSEFSIDRATDEFQGDIERGRGMLERVEERLAQAWNEYIGDNNPAHISSEIWAKSLNTAQDKILEIKDSEPFSNVSWDSREYRYFNPSGNYKGETPEDTRKYVRQDYDRMESLNAGNWCYIGIRAEAEIYAAIKENVPSYAKAYLSQKITSGGLYGIESDSEDEYLESVEQEELSSLKSELAALGFSKRAIAKAFQNIERKDA